MRVLVAMSGGVDSSVAAALLRDEGHQVVGATMRLWGGESDSGCCSVADVEDARRVAAQLGIDHHVLNLADEFTAHVVEPYVADHSAGRTPNPCIECNRHLKFDVFLERAEVLGYDAVATGHHARRVRAADGTWRVARAADAAKDQSYVLHPLTPDALDRVLFPVGEMTKSEVRDRAAALGLRTAEKAESQDVCFITSTEGRRNFLAARTELHPGRVVDVDGTDLGTVDAVEMVTLGQRRGVGAAGGAARRFVVDVDVPGRTVTVGPPERLLVDHTDLDRTVWAGGVPEGQVLAQCSAHGEPRPARVEDQGGGVVRVRFEAPSRRVAPGQSVVLYATDPAAGEVVVGGGLAV